MESRNYVILIQRLKIQRVEMIFLCGDESGQDRFKTPYEVFAVAAIRSKQVWRFSQRFDALEKQYFGLNLRSVGVECKGKNLLKKKKFTHAAMRGPIDSKTRRKIVGAFLEENYRAKLRGIHRPPSKVDLAAYGQASTEFVADLFASAQQCGVTAFATVVPRESRRPTDADPYLRKDYRVLMHRLYSYLRDTKSREVGMMVFDEIERKQCGQLIEKFESYFTDTEMGYRMSEKIIPTPFFVRSDLAPLIQLADLFAYVINWGYRKGKIIAEGRPELSNLAKQIDQMATRVSSTRKDTLPFDKAWKDPTIQFLSSPVDENDKKRAGEGESPSAGRRQEVLRPMPPQQTTFSFMDEST